MSKLLQSDAVSSLSEAFDELLELTAQRVRDGVRSAATLEMQRAHRRWLERELGAETPLASIDEMALERIFVRARPEGGPGPATLRKRASTLRAVLELAHRRRRIGRVPPFPKIIARWRPRRRFLETYQQARALFEALPRHRAEWFWLCLWTAQHASDVERMRWSDVRLYDTPPSLLLRNTKNRKGDGLWVAMPKPLVRFLREKFERERPKADVHIVQPWPSRKTTLPAYCRRLGLPELNAIDLRHTCLTWLVRRIGITPAACAFAGHSSPQMMARCYAHALKAQLNDVADELSAMEPSNDNGDRGAA